jgi:hypothetical protein
MAEWQKVQQNRKLFPPAAAAAEAAAAAQRETQRVMDRLSKQASTGVPERRNSLPDRSSSMPYGAGDDNAYRSNSLPYRAATADSHVRILRAWIPSTGRSAVAVVVHGH